MPNPLFNALGSQNKNGNFMSQFQDFMQANKGKTPQEVLSAMAQEKGITQEQLQQVQTQAQNQAQQIMPQMNFVKNLFGFK